MFTNIGGRKRRSQENPVAESSQAAQKRQRLQELQFSDDDEDQIVTVPQRQRPTNPSAANTEEPLNDNTESGSDQSDEDIDLNQDQTSLLEAMHLEPLPVGEDGYVQGAIVKMVLKNFVTYDYCEVKPGPQLNMIIGPNGTGKSTIVCAIALGLDGSPSVLGRSKNVTDFIKTGTDEATIQIELKQVRSRNTTIRRIIKSNGTTLWHLNGSHATRKEITAVIRDLNIQVDNLCQFLPQDKVAEFAQLTPSLLLTRTQSAVGERKMLEWHGTLIDLRKQENTLRQSSVSNLEHRQALESKMKDLEKDVSRLREQAAISKNITLLKAKLPLAKYSAAKESYEEAKAAEREAHEDLKAAQDEVAPIRDALRNCQALQENSKRKKDDLEKEIRQLELRMTGSMSDISNSKQAVKRKKANIEQFHDRQKQRELEIKKRKQDITNLERNILEKPSSDATSLNEEIDELNKKLDELDYEVSNARRQFNPLSTKKRELEGKIQAKKNELNEINQSGRAKIQALRRYNEDTYKAWAWIRENRESFKGRVHGPIQLDIKLKDTRYANQVEAALGGADSAHLRTFVCEHESDYKHLTRELADKQGLRITAAWPGNISIEDVMKTPCSPEELKTKYKLDYFVMDLLEGAPIVLAYLCQQAKINLCPLSLRAMDPRPLVDDSPFQSFILDKNSYRVRTYTYGRGGTQTSVRGIHPARVLNDSLDIQARDEVRRVLADLDEEMKVVVMNMDDLNKQQQDLKHKIAELKHAKEDAMSKKRDMVRALQLWEGQKRKLQARKRDLESMMQAPETPNQQLDELKQGIIDEVRKRAQLVLNYKTIAQKYVRTLGQRHAVNIELIGAEERQTKMNGFYRERTSELEQCRKDYEKAKVETSQRRQKAREFSNQAQTAGAELQEELADQFKEIYQQWRANGLEQTPEEIEDQINEQQASYDATRSLNPHAAVTYERIKTEIREMNKKADDSETALAKIGSEIEVIHKQWHPRLKRLVHAISSKFSEGLERIGCAGEVGIYEEDNYENWGIEIRVKFRDTEKLQVLTGQRQSGGERAVSTILYLMSLQKLARSPFRVVDEINQGMDPRNERMIHEQIVKAGTIAGTSQYFLITPKLLPDLYYNENMTVLCVHNGEWLPEKRLRAVEVYLQHAVQNLAAA